MAATQGSYSVSIPTSPPPPADLGTYSRFMHQHTKQQMEAASGPSPSRRSRNNRHAPHATTNSSMSSGSRSSRSPSAYSYQT